MTSTPPGDDPHSFGGHVPPPPGSDFGSAPHSDPGASSGNSSGPNSSAGATSAEAGSAGSPFFDSIRRIGLARADDRWICGVAAGVAHRINIDPLIVRGILIVITIFSGLGLAIYGIAWALLPEARDGRIHLQEAIRGRFDAALAGAAIFTLVGLTRLGLWWGDWVGFPLAIGLIGLAVLAFSLLVTFHDSKNGTSPSRPDPAAGASGAPTAGKANTMNGPSAGTPSKATPLSEPPTEYLEVPEPTQSWAASSSGCGYSGSAGGSDFSGPPAGPGSASVPPVGPPPPPRMRTRGPSKAVVRLIWGLVFLLAAALALAGTLFEWPVSLWLVGLGGAAILFGIGVVISGAMGRRSGSLSVMAVLTLIIALPWAFTSSAIHTITDTWNSSSYIGQRDWMPASPAALSDSPDGVRMGSLDADLSALPADAFTAAAGPVDLSVGLGDVTLIVPSDAPVIINAHVQGAIDTEGLAGWSADHDGGLQKLDNNYSTWRLGTGTEIQLRSEQATDDSLVINVDVGLGSINVKEDK